MTPGDIGEDDGWGKSGMGDWLLEPSEITNVIPLNGELNR
jgi:hypothetical protein